MQGEIIHRGVVEFMGFTFNGETLIMTWLAMAITLFLAWLSVRKLSLVPKGWQNVMEMVIEGLHSQMQGTMGKGGQFLAPLIIALFVFLLVSNYLGLIPTLASPTNDLNTTLGLALLIVSIVHIVGLYRKRMHYVKHFFQPIPVFVIINAIEEVAKPVTLSFRLFGNILAGEILIIILLKLIPIWMPFPSVIWLAFSLFVGAVQAFIFTMLSMAYLANAVKDD